MLYGSWALPAGAPMIETSIEATRRRDFSTWEGLAPLPWICAFFLLFADRRLRAKFGQLGAQFPYLSYQFHQIERRRRPTPFGLHLLQATQQELTDTHHRLQNPKGRLRDPRTLVVKDTPRLARHPRRRPLADLFVLVPGDRAAVLALGRQAGRRQGTIHTSTTAINALGYYLAATAFRLRLFERHRGALRTVILVFLRHVHKTRFVQLASVVPLQVRPLRCRHRLASDPIERRRGPCLP